MCDATTQISNTKSSPSPPPSTTTTTTTTTTTPATFRRINTAPSSMSETPFAPATDPRLTDRSLRAAVLDHAIFDPKDPNVKQEIIQAIIQYLQDEGYSGSSMVVQDETNVKMKNTAYKRSQLRRMKRFILAGDWAEVERLLARTTFKSMKAFRYALHRQQFLELIESQETQQAFCILQRRLKELEAYASTDDEFRDLCYLLTCKSVAEAASFRDWDGVAASRAGLVEQYSRLLEFDAFQRDGYLPRANGLVTAKDLPAGRLVHLLQQALAFQIASSRHKPKTPPRIGTLLEDYETGVLPNHCATVYTGHTAGVKCVTFVGEEGCAMASGSGDNTVRVWETRSGRCSAVLTGHKSRIWDVCTTANGRLLASGGGDGVTRIWDAGGVVDFGAMAWPGRGEEDWVGVRRHGRDVVKIGDGGNWCKAELNGHSGDVYTVQFHERGNVLASGGYDRVVRLYDVGTQTVLRTFNGHKSSIGSVAFNGRGNLIISGSKDSTIKLWDIVSGLCVKTISAHLGEVTSVVTNRSGTLLLSGSKDNSNRLWDVRMSRVVRRFKGHQNTSKNFIRAGFGPLEKTVLGGSEDGFVHVWDVESSDLVQKLGPGDGPVFVARWNARQSVLASTNCCAVCTWSYDESMSQQHAISQQHVTTS